MHRRAIQVGCSAVRLVKSSLRWFLYEFIVLAPSFGLSSVLTSLCRIVGSVTIGGLLYVELHGAALGHDLTVCLLYGGLSLLLAVMIGNVVKECLFSFSEQLANWCRQDFTRHGVLLNGTAYREIRRPDGTWIRCESAAEVGTVYVWTDTYGRCHRVVSATPNE